MRDSRLDSPLARLGIALTALIVCAGPAAAQPDDGARVSQAAVHEAARRAAPVRVLVLFDDGAPAPSPFDTARVQATRSERIGAARRRLLARMPASELAVVHAYRHVNAIAAYVDEAGLARLARTPGVLRVELDEGGEGHLLEALPLASVDLVRAIPRTGAGVTVAVLDSGYDSNHPDLADDLVDEACFCGAGCCPGGGFSAFGPGSAEDDNGHGTHVSGILTGAGGVAPEGAAPDVGVVAIKVLDQSNKFCCLGDVTAGLDWLIDQRPEVDLVNLSLGTSQLFTGACDDATVGVRALATAIDTLRARGVTVFASAGNNGSDTQMPAPACIAGAVSVGAVWDADLGSQGTGFGCSESSTAPDQVACFSNSTPTTELFAPGARIRATGIGGGLASYVGTSQASPLAAGCAALLLEDVPWLVPDEIEAVLAASPVRVVDASSLRDYPRVDCADALVHARALPEPATSLGGYFGVVMLAGLRRLCRPRSGRAAPAT